MKPQIFTLASVLALTAASMQTGQAAEVLVEGSFSASAFTQFGSYPVTPDPFDLAFSVVVTIDDATLASNDFFQIDTVLDTIGPSPLTIGGETFTADQISVRIQRDLTKLGHSLAVGMSIGPIDSPAEVNDFFTLIYDFIGESESSVPQTLEFMDAPGLRNSSWFEQATVYSGTVTLSLVPVPCPGDADGDNDVDFEDLNLVLANWGSMVPVGTMGDVNEDGMVDFSDLNAVLSDWEADCN